MSASATSTSPTLTQLVVLLTRPLISVCPPTTVLTLQLALQANLMTSLHGVEIQSPFTFHLSPFALPPAPFYAACLTSGVSWPEWIRVLGGKVMYVFVMEGNIKVRCGEQGEGATVWSEEAMNATKESDVKKSSSSTMEPKLRALLDSVRARAKTRSVGVCAMTADDAEEDCESDAESDADSDSDSESTTSSHLSAFSNASSAESMTSVSSASSLVSSCESFTCVPKISSTSFPAPPKIKPSAPALACHPPSKLPSRSQRRLAGATVNTTKSTFMKYTYQGGETAVVTGGVMLGATPRAAPSMKGNASCPRPAAQSNSNSKSKTDGGADGARAQTKQSVGKGKADMVDNWRQLASRRAVKVN